MKYSIREYTGAIIYDLPDYFLALARFCFTKENGSWITIKNRDETLCTIAGGKGVQCDWLWTSNLYLPEVFPVFGRWLYRQALRDFPIQMREKPEASQNDMPDVTFIIGHRGMERLPLLLATLQTIAGQQGCQVECIVVEQDNNRRIEQHLPEWVRYIHTPLLEKDMAYCRSWAFNVGAQAARADLLVFHDNDMLVPAVYARDLLSVYRKGYEGINLKRFIFYLNKSSTDCICNGKRVEKIRPEIAAIVQNLEAGGSCAIDRRAFFDIGGFDERFVGWGGEDNEFWERAQTRKVYPYGYLPLVHLWHGLQPGKKYPSSAPGVALYQKLSELPVQERIRFLRAEQ